MSSWQNRWSETNKGNTQEMLQFIIDESVFVGGSIRVYESLTCSWLRPGRRLGTVPGGTIRGLHVPSQAVRRGRVYTSRMGKV
jgi:hypothetical protein